jgi:hypothetical protein
MASRFVPVESVEFQCAPYADLQFTTGDNAELPWPPLCRRGDLSADFSVNGIGEQRDKPSKPHNLCLMNYRLFSVRDLVSFLNIFGESLLH